MAGTSKMIPRLLAAAPAFVLLASVMGGWVAGDTLGYVSFGLLVAAVFSDVAILVDTLLMDRARLFSKLMWVAIYVAVASVVFYVYRSANDVQDVHIFWGLAILILSFPISLLVVPLLGSLALFLTARGHVAGTRG